jgi:hypothetical protein
LEIAAQLTISFYSSTASRAQGRGDFMKIEKYEAAKFPDIRECKWRHVRQSAEQNAKACELRFVVCDHGKQQGFCKHHLAIEMEENVRLRAALLAQLADQVIN